MSQPANQSTQSILWVVSEVYYPEETSTGHYLTLISEALANDRPVRVICARPTYSRRGVPAQRREQRRGVDILRVWGTTFDKNRKFLRVVNMLTIGTSLLLHTLLRVGRGSDVLVGTNPPTLPFLVALACWVRGARCHLKVEDVYPDNMVIAGVLDRTSIVTRLLNRFQQLLFRRVNLICVLGRDMERLILQRAAPRPVQTRFIPNWSDVDVIEVLPRSSNSLLRELGLESKFILGYAGNIGPLQDIQHLFRCMCALMEAPSVHFLVIGSGRMCEWLQKSVKEANLSNVTILGPRPRSEQSIFLGACDLGIVSLCAGMAGLGVPSRTYNVMAAARPVLASVDSDSEVAFLVSEEGIGWVCQPGDVESFKEAVLEAMADPEGLRQKGDRCRVVAEGKYSPARVLDKYREVLA